MVQIYRQVMRKRERVGKIEKKTVYSAVVLARLNRAK